MKKQIEITSARTAYRYAKDVFKGLDHEELWVLFLNSRCHPIAFERMTMGGWTSTVIDFRQIFATCLKHKATGVTGINKYSEIGIVSAVKMESGMQ